MICWVWGSCLSRVSGAAVVLLIWSDYIDDRLDISACSNYPAAGFESDWIPTLRGEVISKASRLGLGGTPDNKGVRERRTASPSCSDQHVVG
jgi:hypothetical protein